MKRRRALKTPIASPLPPERITTATTTTSTIAPTATTAPVVLKDKQPSKPEAKKAETIQERANPEDEKPSTAIAANLREQIASSDLTPSKFPDKELKGALELMKSEEWDKNFDAIDSVRRVLIFHPEVIKDQL